MSDRSRHRLRLFTAIAAITVMGSGTPAIAQQADSAPSLADPPLTYVVKAGDTLYDLARDYLRSPSDYRQLQRRNRVVNPRRMAPGRNLEIPVSMLRTRADPARLETFRGQIQVIRAGQPIAVTQGMALMENDILSTPANAFGRVAMSDGSFAVIPSNSRVVLERLRRYDINDQPDYRLRLLQGRLENSVSPRQRPGEYRVITPAALSAVRGTDFRVAYEEQTGTNATALLSGALITVDADSGDAITLTPGEGVFASTDAAGLVTVSLLSPPVLEDAGKPQTAATVAFEAAVPAGAASIRSRIGMDAGLTDPVQEMQSETGRLDFDALADGRWFLRLTAVSDQGMEGRARTYDFIRARNGIEDLALVTSEHDKMRVYRFAWRPVGEGAATFRFQLWRVDENDQRTGPLLVDQPDLSEANYTLTNLPPGNYEWRVEGVRYRFGLRLSAWSEPELLTIS